MNIKFLFVGEKPSNKAIAMKVAWVDGRLAAKQLFDALKDNGIDPAEHKFENIFHQREEEIINKEAVRRIRKTDLVVVGMGQKVQQALDLLKIKHIKIVHPAARGKIRKKERYSQHIKDMLK